MTMPIYESAEDYLESILMIEEKKESYILLISQRIVDFQKPVSVLL